MPPTLEALGIDALGFEDRLTLAEAIWDSVDVGTVGSELRAELERRLELADADPGRGATWDEVRGAARARWKR